MVFLVDTVDRFDSMLFNSMCVHRYVHLLSRDIFSGNSLATISTALTGNLSG